MRSLVAQQVHAPAYNTVPSITCVYYAYWSGVPVEGVELYPRDRCTILAFPTYERQRNEDALPIYEMNTDFAEMKPPSAQMQQLFNALRTNQTELNRYLAALEGTISPSAFFSPDNIARIIAGANQRMPAQTVKGEHAKR